MKTTLEQINTNLTDLPIITADSSNIDQLISMCNNTKVVCTTVGPFNRYGTRLVAACAHFGTNYCDITGEIYWIRKMIDRYDDVAVRTGAKLISCCANGCIPWDLITYKLAEFLKNNKNEKLVKV